jgi:5-deoxy-D-glucuronate isomerase
MNPLIRYPEGFATGYTSLTRMGEENNSLMNTGILKLSAHEPFHLDAGLETAVLLLNGSVLFSYGSCERAATRKSVFDEAPIAIHVPASETIKIAAQTPSELMIIQTDNDQKFKSAFFDASNMAENEHRGRGLLDDTAYRFVRTIFDTRNRPEAKLVLGEVVTLPGRWSSYPPHHHAQPEIYHYRFSEPQGYGHAELGEQVFKVKNFDTIKIFNEEDHAQVAAPGYAMMYVWIIRHLPGSTYSMPSFTKEHDWTRQPGADERVWRP